MKLKGTMVMELTDVNTGEVTTITEENMVTNAVNDILGTNPMGIFIVKRIIRQARCGQEISCPSVPT